ncbi:MAG TPA: hypothetical protein VKP69_15645 [Isosphaeraceae bacterium]|nr:hypothetical protein [Isosphaeraceae bacterium]
MATAWNGNRGPQPARRLRFDGQVRPHHVEGSGSGAPTGHSGRRFVTLAVLGVLVLWGVLTLVFRDWRARYRARAAFGATQVATAIDPLAEVVPPGIAPDAWRRAVAETHAMLVTLTASNLLDLAQMRALRGEVLARVARARPETARDELAGLWDGLSDRAEPVLGTRHPRPKLLPPRPPNGPPHDPLRTSSRDPGR